MSYKFNIGSSNWDSIFDVDVVDENGKIVLNVVVDYTYLTITLSGYDQALPHANAHAFYATIAAELEAHIQSEFFGE